jgi:tricarballylate dehydrogenase
MSRTETCDVIVIGAGSAALEASISARQSGAERVVVLEKAPQAESGGNARFSHTGFRFVQSGKEELRDFMPTVDKNKFEQLHLPAYTNEMFLADLNRVTQGRIDRQLAACFVETSNAAVHWMKEIGIEWEHDTCVKIGDKYYFEPGIYIHPIGGGMGLLSALRDIALNMGVEIRYESRVVDLHGNDRSIQGVRVSTPTEEYDLKSSAVIVCSGGFQASAEMRARYLGVNADLVKVRGSKHNTGEVMQMFIRMGANTSGHWQGAHMTPIDGNAPAVETPPAPDGKSNSMNRYDYPFGISVNSLGQRFFDEGENTISYTYAKTGHAVLRQPGGIAYQIYDNTGIKRFRHGRDYPGTMVEAQSIGELAAMIGIEPDALIHTVDEFNKACRSDVEFDSSKLDGKSTVGISPKKSNWAVPLVDPPFRAYPISAGITFTFGGLQVNEKAQVLNTSQRPIRGLFASGDVMGLFFHNYPSCSGQTRNAVFSYLAGRHAAASPNQ